MIEKDFTTAANIRTQILRDAEELINNSREEAYGDPNDNMRNIANYWNQYLENRGLIAEIGCVTPSDVCNMMILLKVARSAHSTMRDTSVDIAGYAALSAEVSSKY